MEIRKLSTCWSGTGFIHAVWSRNGVYKTSPRLTPLKYVYTLNNVGDSHRPNKMFRPFELTRDELTFKRYEHYLILIQEKDLYKVVNCGPRVLKEPYKHFTFFCKFFCKAFFPL